MRCFTSWPAFVLYVPLLILLLRGVVRFHFAADKWGREMEYVASYITGLVGSDYVHAGVSVHAGAPTCATHPFM